MSNPFRYFNSSPEIIRLAVLMYVKYPLSLRNVEDLLAERGIDISHETVRFWWNRFGPMFAAEIRKRRVAHMARRCRADAATVSASSIADLRAAFFCKGSLVFDCSGIPSFRERPDFEAFWPS